MKKIMLLFLGIILITGCSSNKEKELCNKVDEIDVQTYTSSNNYEELTLILENNYDTYCKSSNTEVCNKLNDYIESTKKEIKLKDCINLDDTKKILCESDNKLAILDKANNVNYMHEEMWAVCNN